MHDAAANRLAFISRDPVPETGDPRTSLLPMGCPAVTIGMSMASLRPALAGVLAEATAAHRAPWQAGLIAFIVGRKGNIGLLEVKDTHGEAAERLLRPSLPLADEAVMIAQDRCRLDGYTIGLTDWTDDVTGMPRRGHVLPRGIGRGWQTRDR